MITASNIFIQYGDRVLMDHIDLVIKEKDRIGLVGRNGAGKSTLLKVISGMIKPDQGTIAKPGGTTLGVLHQEMTLPLGRTVMEETLSTFDEVKELEKQIAKLNDEIAHRTDYESSGYAKLLESFSEANDRYQILGGLSIEAETEKVLKGLGFKNSDFTRLTDEFSGGWKMRVELAKMLLRRPDYLFLDEPTNHLDIESIIWLESFLRDYHGAVIVISHDKQFLDNVSTRTVEIELGKIYDYKTSYKQYIQLRAERREKMQSAFENQQRVIAQKEKTINRFMAKATKTKMAQSMKKQLDKIDRIEIQAEDVASMNIRFPDAPRSGQVVVEAKALTKRYDELLVLENVNIKLDRGDRVAFVGQNGQGKTTLAKILIRELGHTDGQLELGHNVQIGYYAQNQSESLHSDLTVLQTMESNSPPEMRTRLRAILGAFMFSGEDADKKVSVLSGGERARLALASMLLRPFNLLVLDEPTNHLDIISKDVLKQALLNYNGTVIVVSHDRDFLSELTDRTIEFRDHQLFDHLGDVNYFLEKRALDNMREVEMRNALSSKDNNAGKQPISYEERKKLLRSIATAERKIARLEEEIAKFEKTMADPDFYQNPDSSRLMNEYREKKASLEEAMEAWEEAQIIFEEYDSE